ncbi:hypothetical protein ABZ172_12880 [Streptomyces sp. NPDC006296]|uniref:hypothetical protein n=1 Tax=Streptomyces sp. NPDC006296 TaxID=3156746 RepID=UPI0033BBD0B7
MGVFEEHPGYEKVRFLDEKTAAKYKEFIDEVRTNVPLRKIAKSEDLNELQHYLSIINSELEYIQSDSVNPEFRMRARAQLHRRKELIASRLYEVSSKRQISSLREAVDLIPESGNREKIEAELDALEKTAEAHASDSRRNIAEQSEWDKSDALLKQHISERKWNVRAQLLARESVATLVGSLLLVGLATVITVAMFLNVQVTEILTNSFLIVLGYFFGQNSDKRKGGPEV